MHSVTSKSASSYLYIFIYTCNVLFLLLAVSLTSSGGVMLSDTDPFTHIAMGDLFREHHTIPEHDPWSFTAGNYRWMEISWAWDVIFSFIHEQLGWHGAMVFNAVIIALTFTITFIHCSWRSCSIGISLLVFFLIIITGSLVLRPLQVSNLMIAVWILLIGAIMREEIKPIWLALLPPLMLIWVNVHGGFIVGLVILGAFFLQAAYERKTKLSKMLFVTGVVTAIAVFCNPYGISILEAVWRSPHGVYEKYIKEWQPLQMSMPDLIPCFYIIVFCVAVPWRALPILTCERWLAYGWLFMALASKRNMVLFVIFSAPALACALHQLMAKMPPSPLVTRMRDDLLESYNHKRTAMMSSLFTLSLALWLPTPMAAHAFGHAPITITSLDAEIDFLKTHYPKARLITHYNLAGMLIYKTRGVIPVFVDPRTETAIPPEVYKDYACFEQACDKWETMLDRYKINGIMLPNSSRISIARFHNNREWKEVFSGHTATIFMRDQQFSLSGADK